MLEFAGHLYVFTPTSANRLDIGSSEPKFTKLTKYSAEGHQTVTGCGLFAWEKSQFWVSTDQAIFVYSVKGDGSLE